ncbi:MAG: ParB N-terminal domain-containing protein [Thaumarchaeota archaeon]|nr:ParB N-terminal domain-containing protein [Candidatus Calditenuaceae archaeon]MDW8043492.1 ParB N-terminal domain-containing protein [Nitrososphaerota archaeon]
MGKLAFLGVDRLSPHEEIVEELVASIGRELLSAGKLYHPIVVEASHGVILDGSHRFEALRRVGARAVLVYSVDYFSEEVELRAWYRALDGSPSVEEVLEVLKASLNAVLEPVPVEEGLKALERREGSVLVMAHGHDSAYLLCSDSHRRTFPAREVTMADEVLRRFGIRYDTESNVLSGIRSGRHRIGYAVPTLRKEEVIELARRGVRLPPKSTRHVVQDRPLYALVPLELMTSDDDSVRERFLSHLLSAEVVSFGPGVLLDRFYEERVRVLVHRGCEELPYPPEVAELFRSRGPKA